MQTDSTPSPANLDIKLLTIDVKMQIRTLQAKVTFLQETGGMTNEIEQMMAELASYNTNKAESLLKTSLLAPAATAVFPKLLLLKAETMQARSEYTGPDSKHLLIRPGDIIIVYAYISEVTAIGFNTQTNLGGQFPINTSKKVEPQPHIKPEILLCRSPSTGGDHAGDLMYKSGQYIRVCRRERDTRWAYAFNQNTLRMGRICTVNNFTKVEWL